MTEEVTPWLLASDLGFSCDNRLMQAPSSKQQFFKIEIELNNCEIVTEAEETVEVQGYSTA